MPMRRAAAVLILALFACGSGSEVASGPPSTTTTPDTTPDTTGTTTEPPPVPTSTRPTVPPPTVAIRYRLERRVADEATADFAEVVRATLEDPRGWQQAFFDFIEDPSAEYVVVLAEGDEVDALCLPMDTYGLYSCQNGPVVALNADRWRTATPEWTGDLATYKQMLVNHEVGHLLGRHHPVQQCPGPGELAPVMSQQSTELGDCRPNPWPLPFEITGAALHDEPLAPPPDPD